MSGVSNSDTSTQYRLDSLLAKFDWQISGAGSVIMRLKPYDDNSLVHLNFNPMVAKAVALPGISKPVSHILTQLFTITMTYFIAKLDCQICGGQSI